jgi:hypothetical protein
MIVFDLACRQGHTFEGWFASAEAFAQQQTDELVRCPVCDDAQVEKRLSARINVGRSEAPAATPASAPAPTAGPAIAGLPPELLAKLREVVRNTENVGRRFPEEARKIHYDEAPARAIRGQATPEEAAELEEEGIDFTSLPDIVTAEKH